MRIVGFLTTAFLLGSAGAALAQELPDGYGTTMPNGSWTDGRRNTSAA